MASKAVPLVGGFYADDARPWSSQDVCNWIPVLAEQPNTLSPAMYRTPPGLRPFVAVDGAGPVRGARNVEGRLLVVMGNELYQISNTGVAIPRGTIPGVGLVQISHNQQGNSNQVMIVNGSAGYIYDTATLDVVRITDPGFPGAKSVDYLASYFLFTEPSGLYWGHSDLADGLAYNEIDRQESEAKPDRIVAVRSSQLEAVAFNQTTIEFFTNTGAATGTFQSKGTVIETGCASANGIVELDNSLMWLDNKGVFQRMEGYGARPISTRVLERAIAGYDWSSAIAFVWEDRGHKVAYWTFRDGFTVGYDVTTGLWHRRASYGMDRWRLSCLVNWNGKWIGGDFQAGKLYELDWDYPYDGQDPMVRRAVTGALHNEQRRVSVPSIELVFDTGGPSVEVVEFPVQPEGPTITGDAPDVSEGNSDDYQYTIDTNGGVVQSLTIVSGSLPPGRSINNAGLMTGTNTTAGSYNFTIRLTLTNGLYATLADTVLVVAELSWLLASDFTNGNNLKSSSNGADWTSAGFDVGGWTPPDQCRGYRDGDDVLFTGAVSILSAALGAETPWTTLATTMDLGGGQAAKCEGNWFISGGTGNDIYIYDGVSLTQGSWADRYLTTARDLVEDEERLFSMRSGTSTNISCRDSTGAELWSAPLKAVGNGAELGSDGTTVAILWSDWSLNIHLSKTTVAAEACTEISSPFTNTFDGVARIKYSRGLGLWMIVTSGEIAYGETLESLTISAFTPPQDVLGLDEDGTKFIITGASNMIYATSDCETFSPITVANTSGSTVLRAIVATESSDE